MTSAGKNGRKAAKPEPGKTGRRKSGSSLKLTPPLDIYKFHPFRKLIELWVYDAYADRNPDAAHPETSGVHVAAKELRKFIRTPEDELALKQYLSKLINWHCHPDQKALLWDLLDHEGLPTSIDLKVANIGSDGWSIVATLEERKIIEGLTLLGYSEQQIADIISAMKSFKNLTADQVRHYLYFFWNLETDANLVIYPVQLLGEICWKIDRDICLENYCRMKQAELKDPLTMHRSKGKTASVDEWLRYQVKTPYLDSDHRETYRPWHWLVPPISGEVRSLIRPMGSYELVLKLMTCSVTLEDIELSLGISLSKTSIQERWWGILITLTLEAALLVKMRAYDSFSKFIKTVLSASRVAYSIGKCPNTANHRLPDYIKEVEEDSARYEYSNEISVNNHDRNGLNVFKDNPAGAPKRQSSKVGVSG